MRGRQWIVLGYYPLTDGGILVRQAHRASSPCQPRGHHCGLGIEGRPADLPLPM